MNTDYWVARPEYDGAYFVIVERLLSHELLTDKTGRTRKFLRAGVAARVAEKLNARELLRDTLKE